MLKELDTYDWEEAFKYTSPRDMSAFGCHNLLFAREDVLEIYGIIEGENDGDPWRLYGKLNDGRYFYLEAGCDYTGWGCQESGCSSVSSTKAGIIKNGLTDEARRIFGLKEDIVGKIEIKGYGPRLQMDDIVKDISAIGKRRSNETERFKKEVEMHENIMASINKDLADVQDKCNHKMEKMESEYDRDICKICGKIEVNQ